VPKIDIHSKSTSSASGSNGRETLNHLREKGFFSYVGKSLLLILSVYALVVFIVFLVGKYLVDFNSLISGILERLSDRFVILLFFVSESFTGMIPVDLFVIWTQKFDSPLPWLILLGVLSYTGGVISYGIGKWIATRPRIKRYSEQKLEIYMGFISKWGGAFIIIAALLPFTPFSLVVIAVTLFKFPFRSFLLFALARLVRFVLQGIILFDLLKVDLWIL
jgi:membrane protein YqaA with SNARE-associated domain